MWNNWKKLPGLLTLGMMSWFGTDLTASEKSDSLYLFSYTTQHDEGRSGLHFAWSDDQKTWHEIGGLFAFVRSDYGRWGSEKRMRSPYLWQEKEGKWHCVWELNEHENVFAHVTSDDLCYWGRQSYPFMETKQCLKPHPFELPNGDCAIRYSTAEGDYYETVTADFKQYAAAKKIETKSYNDRSQHILLAGKEQSGQIHRVTRATVEHLETYAKEKIERDRLYAETCADDSARFAGLKPIDATLKIDTAQRKPISDMLIGIFFEDISYAADGGLYAEMVQNRDFEYTPSDKEFRDKDWNSLHSWHIEGEGMTVSIDTINPIHPHNKHYATLNVQTIGHKLINDGFDGMALKAGEKYDCALFARVNKGKIKITLYDNEKTIAEEVLNLSSKKWKQYQVTLTARADAKNARLAITPLTTGNYQLDMISLFPQQTFKGRKNGLRADLAQTLADLKPRFVRFPGGCVAHGDGLHNIYHWKNTIGPLETRKPQRNLWGYHQSVGLGYHEYFLFCEDIGAAPLPVVAAGVPCQNSAGGGQQGGIPLSEMDDYIQDILDLIEYANGDAKTTHWGKLRAEAGHPEPFNLQYIGIGNEDLITDIFEERFTMIFNAVKEKHPEITVIGTVGPFFEGTDYVEGWKLASQLKVPMVDEHYYVSPGWFVHNPHFYDRYDRQKPKVYLGEYAAHLPGRPNNLETALAEAMHLANVERNGDIVSMTSYAPLLAKEGHVNWAPDLIFFNNHEVKPTVDYYVQQLYGRNPGNEYLSNQIFASNVREDVTRRLVSSVVRDTVSGDLIIKLVNMLPVSTTIQLNTEGVTAPYTLAEKTTLAGQPGDKVVTPVISRIGIDRQTTVTLEPYSFTVIRINGHHPEKENAQTIVH